jgi:CDP-diacylglycerol--inositol 3-phosphatidyltransferase
MLNQVSSFGSWLDVVVDNIGRAMLWTYSVKVNEYSSKQIVHSKLYSLYLNKLKKFGFMISCIEWMTFCCNQRHGAEWKQKFLDAPYFFKLVFKNNFRTPLGLTAITAGLQILPVWLYVMKQYEGIYFTTTLNICIGYLILLYCVIGRAISLIIEVLLFLLIKYIYFIFTARSL